MLLLDQYQFTRKSDTAISNEGWAISSNTIVDTLAGNDKVTGTAGVGAIAISIAGGDAGASATLNTGTGKDFVMGAAGLYGLLIQGGAGINGGSATINTGDGKDVVTGIATGDAAFAGIQIDDTSSLVTGDGNDVVTGTGGFFGIAVTNGGTLDTGDGNDVVDALEGGFGGTGFVRLGVGNDVLKGFQKENMLFGKVNAFGGAGRDKILLDEGVYTINGNTITSGGVIMNVSEFEQIGGINKGLFDFRDGTLTVNDRGFGTFATA